MAQETFACKLCHVAFPLTADYWHRSPSTRTGFVHVCKACVKIRARSYRYTPPIDHQTYTCKICHVTYPLTRRYWHQDPSNRTGFAYRCKGCVKQHNDRYYQEHRAEIIARKPSWTIDRTKARARVTQWRQAHPDEHKAHDAKYYQTHQNQIKRFQARYKREHPETLAATKKRSYLKHRDKILLRCRQYRKDHPEKAPGYSQRVAIYARDGGKCHLCHRQVSRHTFHLDHIIPRSKGGQASLDNLALAHPT